MRISDWSSDVCSSDLAADGEADDVVLAIRNQYRIRLDTPIEPATLTAAIVFMAERIETLLGIWGIELAPTGDRDQLGLRRATVGQISAIEQLQAGGSIHISDTTTLNHTALLPHAIDHLDIDVICSGTADQVERFIHQNKSHKCNQ